MEALALWREHPRQIASDLRRFFTLDIEDWHQGRLSSYKLLELFGARVEEEIEGSDVHPDAVVYTWHQGELTRRKYASMCKGTRTIDVEFAPDNGALAKSLREGGYSLMELMTSEVHNEIARLRVSFQVANGGKVYEPFEFVDPRIERQRKEKAQQDAAFQKEVEADMFSGFELVKRGE